MLKYKTYCIYKWIILLQAYVIIMLLISSIWNTRYTLKYKVRKTKTNAKLNSTIKVSENKIPAHGNYNKSYYQPLILSPIRNSSPLLPRAMSLEQEKVGEMVNLIDIDDY